MVLLGFQEKNILLVVIENQFLNDFKLDEFFNAAYSCCKIAEYFQCFLDNFFVIHKIVQIQNSKTMISSLKLLTEGNKKGKWERKLSLNSIDWD